MPTPLTPVQKFEEFYTKTKAEFLEQLKDHHCEAKTNDEHLAEFEEQFTAKRAKLIERQALHDDMVAAAAKHGYLLEMWVMSTQETRSLTYNQTVVPEGDPLNPILRAGLAAFVRSAAKNCF